VSRIWGTFSSRPNIWRFPVQRFPSSAAETSYLDSMHAELKRIIAQPQALWNRVVNLILT
jgi:hypothetical protein